MWRDTVKVIVNDSVYEMGKKQAEGVLEFASEQIPFGIYAVEKDGIIELKKEKCKSKAKLETLIRMFESQGFQVHYNEG